MDVSAGLVDAQDYYDLPRAASVANVAGTMQDSLSMDVSADLVDAREDTSFNQALHSRDDLIDSMMREIGCCHSLRLTDESETTSLPPSFFKIQQNTGPLPVCTICTEPAGWKGDLYSPGCGCTNLFYHRDCMFQFATTAYASTSKSLKDVYLKCHVCRRTYSGTTLRFMARQCDNIYKTRRLTLPEKRMAVMLNAGAMIKLGEAEKGIDDLKKLVAHLAKTENQGLEYERFRAFRLLAKAQCHSNQFRAAKKNLVTAENILIHRNKPSETKKLAQIQAVLGLLITEYRQKEKRQAYVDAAERTLSKDEIETLAKKFAVDFER